MTGTNFPEYLQSEVVRCKKPGHPAVVGVARCPRCEGIEKTNGAQGPYEYEEPHFNKAYSEKGSVNQKRWREEEKALKEAGV